MALPFDTSPTTVWTLHKFGSFLTCEVRFVKEGVEVRALQDGEVFHLRVHTDGTEGMAWATMFRLKLLATRWREVRVVVQRPM